MPCAHGLYYNKSRVRPKASAECAAFLGRHLLRKLLGLWQTSPESVLLARLDALVPKLAAGEDELPLRLGRVSRADVARLALVEGLKVLEQLHEMTGTVSVDY